MCSCGEGPRTGRHGLSGCWQACSSHRWASGGSSGLAKALPTCCRPGAISCGRSATVTSRCGESACPGTSKVFVTCPGGADSLEAEPRNIRSLTALRFFAAAMIVVFHSNGTFWTARDVVWLSQGVTFFFVLSGFILAYVYPRLDDATAVRRFLILRIARIWPGHLAAI